MDAAYVNPFINALMNTCNTMLSKTPERLGASLKTNCVAQGDISALIGFAGPEIHGSVALSFPTATALKLYTLMMGEEVTQMTRDVQDSLAELVNIVAGGAQTVFNDAGLCFHISNPSVILGKNHSIVHRGHYPISVLPFQIEKSNFVMEISLKLECEPEKYKHDLLSGATAKAGS